MTTVDELRAQHKDCCDRIVERLETKSSRGEGPNRVLRKVLRHFDKSDGHLVLSADEFVQAMERIGTKLSPSDLDLLLTVYGLEGGGFDGHRFSTDLFGEGGYQTSMVRDSQIAGGIFSADNTPRDHEAPKHRQRANDSSLPGGIFGGMQDPAVAPAPAQRKNTNTSSVAGGIFGAQDPAVAAPRARKHANDSSIPGGIFG